MSKNEWFKLSTKSINWLIFIFSLFLLIGLVSILTLILNLSKDNFLGLTIFEQGIYFSICMALLGSSLFYFRKLYKACINLDIALPINTQDNIRQIGIFTYFVLRPIFAVIFSIILSFALKESLNIMVNNPEISSGFIFANMLLGFYCGYASGDLVDFFEKTSKKTIEAFFEKTNI